MADLIERLRLVIESQAQGAISGLNQTGKEVEGVGQKTNVAKGILGQFGLQGATAGAMLSGAIAGGAVTAAGAIAKFAYDGAQKFVSITATVREFNRIVGTSAEQGSQLVYLLQRLGIEPENAEKAFGRMERAIALTPDTLNKYGIAIERDKQGNTDFAGTLANVAQAWQNTTDPAQRAAMGTALFGKSWQNLTPLLSKSKSEVEAIYKQAAQDHQVFSPKDLETGRQYTVAMTSAKQAITGLQIELGAGLVPALTEGANALTTFLHVADAAAKPVGGLRSVIKDAVGTLLPIIPVIDAFTGSSDKSSAATDELTKRQNAATTAQSAYNDAILKFGPNSEQAATAKGKLAAASDDLSTSEDQVATATGTETAAMKAQKTALDDTLTSFKALHDAQQGALDSNLAYQQSQLATVGADQSLTQANTSVRDAQNSLDEAVKKHGRTSQEARDATDALNRAKLGLMQSSLGVQQAVTAEAAAASKQAQDNLGPNASATARAITGQQAYKAELERLANSSIPSVRTAAQRLLDKYNAFPSTIPTTFVANTQDAEFAMRRLQVEEDRLLGTKIINFTGGPSAHPQQFGGPFSAGELMLVGERGPELAAFGRAGRIIPNNALRSVVGSSGGGRGGLTVQLIVQGSLVHQNDLIPFLREALATASRNGWSLPIAG